MLSYAVKIREEKKKLNCRCCDGEATPKIIDGKSTMRNCNDCLAETCIKDGKYEDDENIYEITGNKMGFTDLEGAKKLCSCFANNHKGGIKTKPSEIFIKAKKNIDDSYEKKRAEEEKREFTSDKEKQESLEIYQNRKEELAKLDAEHGDPTWILDQ